MKMRHVRKSHEFNKVLSNTVIYYGAVVGSFARWLCMDEATEPNDVDIAPFSVQKGEELVGELCDEWGYNVIIDTDNAYNLEHQWGHYPDVDVLKKRVGSPIEVINTFPLHNEAFALVSPVLVLTTAEAIQAEISGCISVQNWYDDTPKRIGKLISKPRKEPYIVTPIVEDALVSLYSQEVLNMVTDGSYADWKDLYHAQ